MRACVLLTLVAGSSGAALYGGRRNQDWPSTDLITQVAAGTQAVSAVYSFVSPIENLRHYGVSRPDSSALAAMRFSSAVQLVSAAVIMTGFAKDMSEGRRDGYDSFSSGSGGNNRRRRRGGRWSITDEKVELASSTALLSTAVALLLSLPGFEGLDGNKEIYSKWIVLLFALGELSLKQKIEGFLPACVLNAVVGAQFFARPDRAAEMYNIRGTSKTALDLLQLGGAQLLGVAGYLLGAKQRSHAFGLATYLVANAASAVKFAFVDEKDGGYIRRERGARSGYALWAGFQGVLAALAFNNDNNGDWGNGFGGGRRRRNNNYNQYSGSY